MAGFGHGGFGNDPFGRWRWAKAVLFDSIPELQRNQDRLEQGGDGALESWASSQAPLYDALRLKISTLDTIRDPLEVRTQYDEVYTLRLGPQVVAKQPVTQRGVDGSISSFREFVSASARFTSSDEGKELALRRSSIAGNNTTVTIVRVVDTHTAVTDPTLAVDSSSLRWELRAKAAAVSDRITVRVQEGDVSSIVPGHLLSDGSGEYEVLARRLFERTQDRAHLTDREGADGSIDGSGRFVAASLSAVPSDSGKYLFIAGVDNDVPKRAILSVTSATTVVIDGDTLDENAGPLFWALLPFPELDLATKAPPQGVIEQQNVDLTLATPDTVSSPSMRLTADDVGKYLRLRGSSTADNNNSFLVTAVLSDTSATIEVPGALTLANASSLTWELRSPTLVGDLSQVTVAAPSLITYLARDFGIEVDTQENEARQRSWVKNITQWIDKKGTSDAYKILATISGFDSVVAQLFNLTRASALAIPTAHGFEVGDAAAGRLGTDGSLTRPGSDTIFSSPTALFVNSDVDLLIRIVDSGSGNDGLYTITEVVDAQNVFLDPAETLSFTYPEASNGALTWSVVRLYTDLSPIRPLFDDMDADLMSEMASRGFQAVAGSLLADGQTFTIDDGVNALKTFEFDSNASVIGGHVAVTFTGGSTVEQVTTAMVTAINGASSLAVTAFTRFGGTVVSILRDDVTGPRIKLSEGVGNAGFTVTTPVSFFLPDTLCSEDGLSTLVNVLVVSVASTSYFTHQVRVAGTDFPDAPSVVKIIGNWFFTDSLDVPYFLDSVPTVVGTYGGNPLYQFDVTATVAPAVGVGTLDYQCPVALTCDHCGASKVLIRLTAGSITQEEGVAVERALERLLERLKQVTPAHVDLIPIFETQFEAVVPLTATITTP